MRLKICSWQCDVDLSSDGAGAANGAARLAPGPRAKLVITMQGLPEREVALSRRPHPGRARRRGRCAIDSVFISRYHALIVRDNSQDLMLDLGSTNGLLVNSRRILRRALRHRDLIQVGPARVMYFNEQAAAPPSQTRARRSASRGLDFRRRRAKKRPAPCWLSVGSITSA